MSRLAAVERAEQVGIAIARYGLILSFVFIGLAKFTPEEAQGIQPLVARSPLMSWMYAVGSLQEVSNAIGVFELLAGALLVLGSWWALPSLVGGLMSAVTFLSTVSFLFSTPGAIVFAHGLPWLGATGQFLIKDVVLLGASVLIAATSWKRLRGVEEPTAVTARSSAMSGIALIVLAAFTLGGTKASAQQMQETKAPRVLHKTTTVDGLKIFYREAGPKNAPKVVLLHGFPSSSHMFRELIPLLADKYHVIAPDYPGFGYSDAPAASQFAYTFDHLTDVVDHFLDQQNVTRYAIYIQDYGAPVGFRLATRHPERIQAIITQNGNAYDEGLAPFWAEYLYPYWSNRNPQTEAKVRQLLTPETTRFQYTQGYRDLTHISPDAWTFDQVGLDRTGNDQIQLDLFYDYRKNPPLYPQWHKYLHDKQPPVLAVWGKNDPIFAAAGAEAFRREDPNTELHLLDTGHFALEEDGAEIAQLIHVFLDKNVK